MSEARKQTPEEIARERIGNAQPPPEFARMVERPIDPANFLSDEEARKLFGEAVKKSQKND